MPEDKVMSKVELSPYDEQKMREFATEIVEDLREWGTSGARVEAVLERAWALGFTAVSRGEQTSHPPRPDWMTDPEVSND